MEISNKQIREASFYENRLRRLLLLLWKFKIINGDFGVPIVTWHRFYATYRKVEAPAGIDPASPG